MAISPFDYINSINNKEYIFDKHSEKDYNPFIVNLGFSYFMDTVLLANELNKHSNIPNKAQYDFLYHSVTKKKRFSKWVKKEDKVDENLQLISDYFGFSLNKAKDALKVLTDEQIEQIKLLMDKGGKT